MRNIHFGLKWNVVLFCFVLLLDCSDGRCAERMDQINMVGLIA